VKKEKEIVVFRGRHKEANIIMEGTIKFKII